MEDVADWVFWNRCVIVIGAIYENTRFFEKWLEAFKEWLYRLAVTQVIPGVDDQINRVLCQPFDEALLALLPRG